MKRSSDDGQGRSSIGEVRLEDMADGEHSPGGRVGEGTPLSYTTMCPGMRPDQEHVSMSEEAIPSRDSRAEKLGIYDKKYRLMTEEKAGTRRT